MQVLIATENKLAAKSISLILRNMGHSCTICLDCSNVELYIKTRPVELVLSDVNLKSKEGNTITYLIRNYYKSSIPIILMAAIHEEELLKAQLDQGANDYILYPVDKQDLIQKTKLQLA